MPVRRNKYSAVREVVDGITFDSKREAKRYRELKLLEAAGEIRDLELQPKFPLVINGQDVRIRSKGYPGGRRCSYTADFKYVDVDKRHGTTLEVIEDTKGYDTPASRLRRAVVECIYSIEIRLV